MREGGDREQRVTVGLAELERLAGRDFLVAAGFVRPHYPYVAPARLFRRRGSPGPTASERHTKECGAEPPWRDGSLARAQTIMGVPTKQFIINPKAIPVSELYGMLDPATRDWTDGLLSNIFRDMNKPVAEGKDERRGRFVREFGHWN